MGQVLGFNLKRKAVILLVPLIAVIMVAVMAVTAAEYELELLVLGRKMRYEQQMSDLAYGAGGAFLNIEGLGLTEFSYFCFYESGSEGLYNAVNGDNGHAFGAYQFDNRYELQPFLKYCVEADPVTYAPFQPYLSVSRDSLQGSSGLASAWRQVYASDPHGFSSIQDQYVIDTKLNPVMDFLAGHGIHLEDRPMVIKGLVISIHNRKGWETTAGYSIVLKSGVSDSTSDEEFIRRLCQTFGEQCPGEINMRYNVDYSAPACDTICERNMATNILHGEYRVSANLDGTEIINNVPYLSQLDYGHVPYNGSGKTVKSSGCGITSFSMVASWTLGRLITPEETAPWAMANNANTVKDWDSFRKLSNHYGCHLVGQYDGPLYGGSVNRIIEALQNGYILIASHTSGYFNPSNRGHYVVFTGITSDGCIIANDPASRARSGIPVDLSTATKNCKQIWVFSKY